MWKPKQKLSENSITKLIDAILSKNNKEIENWLSSIVCAYNSSNREFEESRIAEVIIKTVDNYGNSLLHYCATVGNTNCLKLLVDHVFPELMNVNRATPLHNSAQYGHYDCAALLIEKGCVINTSTNFDPIALLLNEWSQ